MENKICTKCTYYKYYKEVPSHTPKWSCFNFANPRKDVDENGDCEYLDPRIEKSNPKKRPLNHYILDSIDLYEGVMVLKWTNTITGTFGEITYKPSPTSLDVPIDSPIPTLETERMGSEFVQHICSQIGDYLLTSTKLVN